MSHASRESIYSVHPSVPYAQAILRKLLALQAELGRAESQPPEPSLPGRFTMMRRFLRFFLLCWSAASSSSSTSMVRTPSSSSRSRRFRRSALSSQYGLNVPVSSTTTRCPSMEDGISPEDPPFPDTKTFRHGLPPERPMAVPVTPGRSITFFVSLSRALFISSAKPGACWRMPNPRRRSPRSASGRDRWGWRWCACCYRRREVPRASGRHHRWPS